MVWKSIGSSHIIDCAADILTAVGGRKRAPATKNKTAATTAAVKRKAVTSALAEQYAISPQTAAARRQAKSQAVVGM